MNLIQIMEAISSGMRVFWKSESYEVIRDDKAGRYLIRCANGHSIGLTWADNRTLNGKEEDFYKVN